MFYSKVSLLTLLIQHLSHAGCQHVSHCGISNVALRWKLRVDSESSLLNNHITVP